MAMAAGCGKTDSDADPAEVAVKTADSDTPMSDEIRQYVWDIEHLGFVIEATVFPGLKSGISQSDFAAWDAFLAGDCAAEIPAMTLESRSLASETAQFGMQNYASRDLVEGSKKEFLQWLRSLRDEFDECSTSMGLVRLSPDQPDLSGTWKAVWRLRMAGTAAQTKMPAEKEMEFTLSIKTLDDTIGEQKNWVTSIRVMRATRMNASRTLFLEATKDSGLVRTERHDNWNQKSFVPNTGGVYLTDYNGDGHLDVFIDDHADGNRLYCGLGDGRFEDTTIAAGIDPDSDERIWTLSCWIDIDNDGDDDLIAEDRIYENLADGTFQDVTEKSNLPLTPAAGYAVGDYNSDGLLDLYVCHTSAYRVGQPERSKVKWIDDGLGIDNILLKNLGDWQFQDVTRETNTGGNGSSCFTALWIHANDDNLPDLFAINEFGINSLLINTPEGRFEETDVDPVFGGFSMGVAAGDYDNDGRTDLYVANMYSKAGSRILANVDQQRYPKDLYRKIDEGTRGSKLYRATPGRSFDTVPADDMFAYVGWAYGPAFVDLDNDGWLDIYATAGFKSEERGKPDG